MYTQSENDTKFAGLFETGKQSIDTNEYIKALEIFTEILHTNPNDPNAYHWRGYARFGLGDMDGAWSDCKRSIELNNAIPAAYANRGMIYRRKGKYKEAIVEYNKAIALNLNYARAYYNRGNVFFDLKKMPEAIANYSTAIKLDPTYKRAYYGRSLAQYILAKKENYKSITADLDKAQTLGLRFTLQNFKEDAKKGSKKNHGKNITKFFKEDFFETPIWVFCLIATCLALLLAFADRKLWGKLEDSGLGQGVLVEAHGFLLDIFCLGILLSIYEYQKKKREKIQHKKDTIKKYEEEIEDLRYWAEGESAYRIAGLIRRLNYLDKTDIDLHHATLANITLSTFDLEDYTNKWENVPFPVFESENLPNLSQSYFYKADLTNAVLKGAILKLAWFNSAVLVNTNLCYADLRDANFTKADLTNAKLLNARVHVTNWFEYLIEQEAKGVDELVKTYNPVCKEVKDEANKEVYYIVTVKDGINIA